MVRASRLAATLADVKCNQLDMVKCPAFGILLKDGALVLGLYAWTEAPATSVVVDASWTDLPQAAYPEPISQSVK
jgi:hypothetical protein